MKTSSSPGLALTTLGLLLAFAAGCGGAVDGGSGSTPAPAATNAKHDDSAATPAPSDTAAPTESGSVAPTPAHAVDASTASVTFERLTLGLFIPASECDESSLTMTYDRSTFAATWKTCEKNTYIDIARTLTTAERTALEAALANVTYTPDLPCDGYDGVQHSMTTLTAGGEKQLYVSANLNCYTSGRRVAAKLFAAMSLLDDLRNR